MAGKPVTPTFCSRFCSMGRSRARSRATPPEHWHELHTILDACDRAVREAQRHMSIPRRFSLGHARDVRASAAARASARASRAACARASAFPRGLRLAAAASRARSRAARNGGRGGLAYRKSPPKSALAWLTRWARRAVGGPPKPVVDVAAPRRRRRRPPNAT